MGHRTAVFGVLGCSLAGLMALSGCAGKSGADPSFNKTSAAGSLALTVSASDTCGGAGGTFSHIYLAVSDVQISPNASALPGDPSFVDLTPGLKSQPVQVDVLGTANQCVLTTLASNLNLTPGSYAQLRVVLVPDSSSFLISGNKCGASANCVTFSGDVLNTPHPIQLGTETTQGIQVGPNQIAGGSFNASGQSQTLGLNFDSCASLVALGSNQFRLRPVIFAGDTSSVASISGQVVDSSTLQPVANGQFTVALEQKDNRLVDRVMMESTADSKGNFALCPVPAGSFDVVASGQTSATATYAATAALGTPAGTNLNLPMTVASSSAGFNGVVDLQGVSQPPAAADVTISALQLIAPSGLGAINVTVPLLQSPASTLTLPTLAGCPANTPCALFTITVPPANVVFGQFNASGTTYSQSSSLVSYSVEGTPSVALSGASPDCDPSFASVAVSNVTAGTSQDLTTQPLSFSICQ